MGKIRLYEIAREVGIESKALVEKLQTLGFEVKSHASALEEFEAREVIEKLSAERKANVVEKRIGARVIRRRHKLTPQPALAEAGAEQQSELETEPSEATLDRPAGEFEHRPERFAVVSGSQPAPAPSAGNQPAVGLADPEAPARETLTGPKRHASTAVASRPGSALAEEAEQKGARSGRQKHRQVAADEKSSFYRAKIVRRATPSESAKYQAQVISRPSPEAAKPTGIRVLKVVPGKEGRGNQFIDVSNKQEKRKRTSTRAARTDMREAMFDAFTPGYTPGLTRRRRMARSRGGRKTTLTTPKALKRVVKVETDQIGSSELARRMGVKLRQVNMKLRELGEEVENLKDDRILDLEVASMVAQEFDHAVQDISFKESELLSSGEDVPEDLVSRPPVVTVMGHVDHGKTSILDAIRQTEVTEGEAGGITQHIGAYEVQMPNGSITFIDTPGHEAFTAMRARGAQITDIVVLVVAADDGIMPQTIEAINHAKDAGVPIMVAVNKIDLPDASAERIRQDLTKFELVPEQWGGDTIVSEVSAKTKVGLDSLLDNILLQSELLELKANPTKLASGTVIEARLDRGRGPVATLLISSGTLRRGDTVLAGTAFGRIRMMYDHEGKPIEEVRPGRPVQVQGLNEVPIAGEAFYVVKNEREARRVIEHRKDEERVAKQGQTARLSLEDFYEQLQGAEKLELKVLVKADVQGTAEAVRQALEKLSTDKVGVKVIHRGVGAVSETDVNLASASNALVVGFNVRPDPNAKKLAQKLDQEIRLYNVIYDMTEDMRKAQEGLLPSMIKENVIGRAEVRDLFVVPKVGTVAGVAVLDGKMVRNAKVRLLRDSVEVYSGKLNSLKRFKEDAREVQSGYECGVGLEGFNDIKRGDVIEAFVIEEERQSI